MFEAFDRGARRVVIRARLEGQRRAGIEVAGIDLLEALLAADDDVGALLAGQCRHRPRAAAAADDGRGHPGRPRHVARDAYVGIEVIRATSRRAQVAAMRRGHPVVTSAHLAIALLEPASVRCDPHLARRAEALGLDPVATVAALDAHLARHHACGRAGTAAPGRHRAPDPSVSRTS